jgi:glycosyltransferase involved in cell wall biosynthesis
LRIAILAYTFPRGMGYIGNMLPEYLARLGADVHYITMDLPHYFQGDGKASYGAFEGASVMSPGAVEVLDGFTLHCLGHQRRLGQMRYSGLDAKLRSLRPNVVQSLLAIGWIPLDAARLSRRLDYRLFSANHTTASVFPLAQHPTNWWEPRRISNLATRYLPGRWISHRTEKCYAATVDCAVVATRFFGVEPGKVEIVPLGVDTELFFPVRDAGHIAEREQARDELGVADDEVLFIYTGQFSDAKNPKLLAEAVARMRHAGSKVSALFLGDGAQRADLERTPGCEVRGFVPHRELGRLYRAADVGVWPTQESTSMLDAAACGVPIVVNHTLQAVERIEGNGMQYKLNDVQDLIRVLEELRASPALRERLGNAGAAKMARDFSWASLARRRLTDYQSARAGKQDSPSAAL